MTLAPWPSSSPRPIRTSPPIEPRLANARAITLPDGSIATLDTDSALKIGYTTAERGVRLLRGQALFEVAKHKSN